MPDKFDFFVMLAEMRTGSNHLQESLNAFGDLYCHGEMFNPVFMGKHNRTDFQGYTVQMRDEDPMPLIDLMIEHTQGLPGFRFFHEHDPRVIEPILANPRCAKIILTRNPVDSYISLKIARETDQWRLAREARRREARITFDAAEFNARLESTRRFQDRVQRTLQVTGQSAFYLKYEDITNLDVVNGLAAWLGSARRLDALPQTLKRQNPATYSEKVTNADEMEAHLAQFDPFALSEAPQIEPKRGAGVPGFMTAASAPMLFMPVPGGLNEAVASWLHALDETPAITGHSQKTLRQWMRGNKGFTAFTVVSHPLVRAHRVFNTCFVSPETPIPEIRRSVIERHRLPIPLEGPDAGYSVDDHRVAFAAFLEIVKQSLLGANAIRLMPMWSTQTVSLQSMGKILLPHRVIREDDLAATLKDICAAHGRVCPDLPASAKHGPIALEEIHDKSIEDQAVEAYRRDYLNFGFRHWSPSQAA